MRQSIKYFTLALAFTLFLPLMPAQAADEVSPEAVEGAVTINVVKAKELFDEGVLFVDVRKDSDWDAGRIPGAEHLELKSVFTEESLLELVENKDEPLVLYCNGHNCLRSSDASAKAVGWGFSHVYYFRDGFPAWKTSGYPVE